MKLRVPSVLRSFIIGFAVSLLTYNPQAGASTIPTAQIVTVGANQWAQPSLFKSASLSDITSACSPTTGQCSGTLSGYDLTGWTWATPLDVVSLYNSLLPSSDQLTSANSYQEATGTIPPWAYSIFSAGFTATYTSPTQTYLQAFARPPSLLGENGLGWFVINDSLAQPPYSYTQVGLASFSGTDPSTGAYLYKSNTVPEPPVLALMGIGLIGLVATRRRKKKWGRNA